MAQIYCRNCGQVISDTVVYCPHCGTRQGTFYSRPVSNNSKDKLVAALLALFLGSFGIHFFYLEKTTAGLVTILLSIFSCGIWAALMFIQGIYMLLITDEDFNRKYVDTTSTIPLF